MTQIINARFAVHVFAVSIIGVFGCGQSLQNPDEAEVVANVRKLGGKVEFEGQGKDQRVIKIYLHKTAVTDADLADVKKLPKLRNLFLGRTNIGDTGLEHLRTSSELQTLSLNSTRITDAGLKALTGLTKLKTLNLQDTQVTAASVSQLRKALPGTTIAR